MSEQSGSPAADLPVAPHRAGVALGFAVLGVALLIVLAFVAEQLLDVLIGGLLVAPLYALGMWLAQRRSESRRLGQLLQAPEPGRQGQAVSFRRGVLVGLVGGGVGIVVGFAVYLLLSRGTTETMTPAILPGIVLGAAGWQALSLRDLAKWQRENNMVVFTRLGARRFNWTKLQAQDAAVAVASPQVDRVRQ